MSLCTTAMKHVVSCCQFVDVSGMVQHVLNLLKTEGQDAIAAAKACVTAISAFRTGNYSAIWAALNEVNCDTKKILAAFKVEFDLSPTVECPCPVPAAE